MFFNIFINEVNDTLNHPHICSSPFTAGRYHSLVNDKESFPAEALEISAWTEDGLVMVA